MSNKTTWPNKKGLQKKIGRYSINLGKACDLQNGKGWFCQAYFDGGGDGFGFHKTNKFTAVRKAIKDVENSIGYLCVDNINKSTKEIKRIQESISKK